MYYMSTMINIRTDEQTKKEIAKFAESVGLSVSAFATAVLKQAVRDGEITLKPTLEPTPYLKKIMREVDADVAAGKNMSKAYDDVDDFFKDLKENK